MDKKYFYIVIYAHSNGIGNIEIYRDKPVETRTEYKSLLDFVREENKELGQIAITNIMGFKNK